MLGIGNVFAVLEGRSVEVCDAQGAEVLALCGRERPVALTLSNGMKPLRISGDSSAAVPQQLDDIARAMTVRQLSEGEAHGIAVTSLGACYVWGDLSFTGRPADAARADEPRLQPRLEHISVSRVAAGDEHCVVVTEDHGVYAWGRNREGQCGTGPSSPPGQICPPEPIDDRVPLPRFVAALHAIKIRDVAAGASFSVCLALDGSVYTFGEGLAGQLGLGRAVTCSAQPQRVSFDVTAALTDAEGAARRSKRGAGSGTAAGASSFTAAAAASLSAASARSERSGVSVAIVDISAGAAHVLARSASGHVFTWGLGSKGQLGLGDLHPRQAPVLVRLRADRPAGPARGRLLVASCISAGRFHSAALTRAPDSAGAITSTSGGSSADAGASSGSGGSVVFVWGAAHLGPAATRATAAVRPCSAAGPCSPLRPSQSSSSSTDAASAGTGKGAGSTPIVQRWPLPTGVGPLAAVPRERRRRGSASPGRSTSPTAGRGGSAGSAVAAPGDLPSQSASPTTEGVARGAAALIPALAAAAGGGVAEAGVGAAAHHSDVESEAASIDAVAAGAGAAHAARAHHGSTAGAGAAGAHVPAGIAISAEGDVGEDKAARRARVEAGTFQVPLARTRAHASLRLREREYAVRKAALDAAAAAAVAAGAAGSVAAASSSASSGTAAAHADVSGSVIVPLQSARSAPLAAGEGYQQDGAGFHAHDADADAGVAAVATGGTAGAMKALHISPAELLAAADAEAAAARGRRPPPFGSQHAAAAGLIPTGELNPTVLHRIAASAGVRLRDAPPVAGAPWCRQPRPASDPKVEGEVLLYPTPLDAPFLRGSARAAAVACGHGYTAVFLPAQVASVDPAVTLDTGGRLLTLHGQALGSVCRLGHAYRDAASLGSFGASIAARNPNAELLAQAGHAHPDGTGMVPIPGVLVRFALTDRQPGRREDDPPEYDPDANNDDDDDDDDGDDDGGRDGAGSTGGSAGARAREAQRRIWYARAYFPPGWATELSRDVPGLANDAYCVSSGTGAGTAGAGAGAAGFHGAVSAVGAAGGSGGEALNLDCLVAVAPAVPRPCKVKVSVLLKPPRPWLSALSDTAAALPVPIGVGAVPLELDVIASGGVAGGAGGRNDLHDLAAGAFGYGGATGAATASLARPSTMRRRGQVLHGAPTLDFLTLPIINEAQPPLLRLPEPAPAAPGGSSPADRQGGSLSARSGAAPLESGAAAAVAAPPEDAPVVTLTGEHLFGAALVDPLAAPVAEHLIDLVKAAVRAREREEAYLLVSEAGLPPLPLPNREDAGATVPARLGRGDHGREGKAGDDDHHYDEGDFGGVDGSDDGEDEGAGGGGTRSFAGLRPEGGRAGGERKAGDYNDDEDADEDEEREQGEKIDLLLPTLHLQRGMGSAAHPDGVLVRFAVYSAPAPPASRARGRSRSPGAGTARSGASAGSGSDAASSATGSSTSAMSPLDSLSPLTAPQPPSASDAGIIAAPTSPKPQADPTLGAKLLGHSAPARGWFSLHYDEHLLHVGAAVDKMTGTTKAAAKIAAAPTAGGSSVFASGSSVFNSGSSVFAGGSKFAGSVFSTAASGASAFGGGGGGGGAAGSKHSATSGGASAYDAGDDDDEEDAEDDEGVIGRYSATISVRLPDVAAVLARAHGGASGSSGSAGSAGGGTAGNGLPVVPEAIWGAFKALLAGSIKSGAAGSNWLASAAAAALRLDAASAAAAAAFSWEREFEAAVAKRRSAGGGLLLRPEISVNGGKDFIAGAPASVITAINPSVSHVVPPVGPGAGGFDLVIRGTGLVDAPNLLVRFTPLLPHSESAAAGTDEHAATDAAAAAAEAAVTVKATFIDATAVRCVVPELPRIAGDGSLLPPASDIAPGYSSYSVQLSSDGGRTLSGGPRMRLVGWWGAAAPAGPIPGSSAGAAAVGSLPLVLVPMGGRTIKLPLAPRPAAASSASSTAAAASFDAWCESDSPRAGAAGGPGTSPLRSRMSSLASDGSVPTAAAGGGIPGSLPSTSPPGSPRVGAGSGASVVSMSSAPCGPAGSASQLALALRGSWVPPIALVGHPIYGLGCRTVLHLWQVGASGDAIAASSLPAPAGKSTVARVAALGTVTQVKPEGAHWAAPPVPALPTEGEADALSVAIPALSSVLPPASGGSDGAASAVGGAGTGAVSPAPAPGAGTPGAARGGSAPVASLPVPPAGPPPELRHAVAELHLWGRPVPASRLRIRYFDPASLTITAVGPKKIALGGEIVATVDGIDALIAGRDGLPLPPPVPGKASAGAAKGKDAAAAATAAAAAAAAAPEGPPPVLSPVPADALLLRLRVSCAGTSQILSAKLDGSNVTAALPADAAALAGDATIEVSIDGGVTFTAAFATKIAKK